ncbi:MAG: type II toxin-antitoxin system MqsA family antitoxin [Candidatus Desulfaltia sp.]|nr:type II toxin-antitoxin system MqsA family antitoxin [Candidatus Desulfaltia sp.]
MHKDGDKCPVCGLGALTKKSVEEVFDYKGETLKIKGYVIYECPVCEESIVDRKTLKDTKYQLIEFRRKVDNLLTPNEIREIRTLFGYTQEEFGAILGGGKKAFARYENGTITQSRAMDNQLKMLKRNPEILAAIVGKLPDFIKTSHVIDSFALEENDLGFQPKNQFSFADVTKGEDDFTMTSAMSTAVSTPHQNQRSQMAAAA